MDKNSDIWTCEKNAASERAIKELQTAKKLERSKIKKGWKYVAIQKHTQVLVPCDKKGNPTRQGLEMIERLNKLYGIEVDNKKFTNK